MNDYNKKIDELQTQRHVILKEKAEGETKLSETKAHLEQIETEIREKSGESLFIFFVSVFFFSFLC